MSDTQIFPVNEAFYEVREITDFKDLINQSAVLFHDKPAYKIKNDDGIYFDILYSKFKDDIYYLGTSLLLNKYSRDKMGIMASNCYKWCVSYLAVTVTGNIAVPMDKELPTDDLLNIINVSGMKVLFTDKKSVEKLVEIKDKLPKDFKIYVFDNEIDDGEFLSYKEFRKAGKEKYKNGDKSVDNVKIDPNALSVLLFTSGTTGMSKGVCLSQKNICSDLTNLSGVVKINSEDQLLSVLPLHHTYECSLGFLMIIYSGACIAFCEGLRYIVQNMQEVQPTIFVTVPLMIEKMHHKIIKTAQKKRGGTALLNVGKFAAKLTKSIGIDLQDKIFSEITKTFGGRMRLFITGAAALDPRVAEDFMTFGIDLYIGYGLTECSPLVIGNNDRLKTPDTVGTPLPNVIAKIDKPDALGVGEILVKGPMVMLGYYNDEQATRDVFDDEGWFHTGDLGTIDEDNNYRITGRSKNIIVTKNGKNIFPEEVELYLNRSPMVGESMVFGKDDGDNDETVVSAKILPNVEEIKKKYKNKENITSEDVKEAISDVIREVNKHLPNYKNIKHFDIRDNEFVKTTTQKIKRYANLDNDKEAENKPEKEDLHSEEK